MLQFVNIFYKFYLSVLFVQNIRLIFFNERLIQVGEVISVKIVYIYLQEQQDGAN